MGNAFEACLLEEDLLIKTYQILEIGLTLESDDDSFVMDVDADYLRFAAPAPLTGRKLSIRYHSPANGRPPSLEVDGSDRSLVDHPDPGQYARFAVHGLIMDSMESFTILHAAVLESQGGALAISGSPGTGKTTLTMDLLEAGLGFMSDDFCPVHQVTRLVHPYPRSLWIREPGDPSPSRPRMLHRGKRQMSPEPGRFRVMDAPCPLRGFIHLDPGQEAPGPAAMEIRLRPADREAFMEEAGQLPGLQVVRPSGGSGHELRVHYERTGPATRALMDLLMRHREAVWNFFGLPTSNPDFTREPTLQPIPSHEAAFILLRERKQRVISLEGTPLAPGALLAHLNAILEDVPCYRLTAGPRDRRLQLVLQSLDMGVQT